MMPGGTLPLAPIGAPLGRHARDQLMRMAAGG
jgi:hypothetical protein